MGYQDSGRESLGLPADKLWYVSPETYEYFDGHKKELAAKYDAWQETFAAWETANPELAKKYADAQAGVVPDLDSMMPSFEVGSGVATRNAGAEVLQPIAESMPFFVSGSADLHGSNKNYMKGVGDFSKNNYAGRNFYYGIREHAMGAIMNGMAFYGLFRTSGSTFLVFSDYMRASVRVAALSHLPTNYIWTHDSIGVGEDGPTHQPIETVSSMRLIPNLDVSRQNLPVLDVDPALKKEGTKKGGYTLIKEEGELERIIIGIGSELSMAVDAAKELGAGTRVVSMPCLEAFERQPAEYIEEVLPAAMKSKTTAVEAGVSIVWYKYADKVQGVDTFGMSAPAEFIFEEKGMTVAKLVELAK